MAISKITNHQAQALARLKEQFKDKSKYVDFVLTLTAPAQPVEDALWQLLTERAVDTAVGAQLDNLGVIVGEPRNGSSDAAYRPRIRARIAANRSSGTTDELLQVLTLLLGDAAAEVVMTSYYPAAIVVKVNNYAVSSTFAVTIISFLKDAAAAGVRVILESSQQASPATVFAFAKSTFLNGAALIAATTLTVDSTEGFPDAGTLHIAQGLAGAQTLTYTGKTLTTFTGVTALTSAHVDNTQVAWGDSPGLGWDQGFFASAED